jgi:hypothetical protein
LVLRLETLTDSILYLQDSDNMDSYKDLGKRIGLALHDEVPSNYNLGEMEAFDVESDDPTVKQASTYFCKSASHFLAQREMEENGASEAYFLFCKMAEANEWFEPMVEILEHNLDDHVKVAGPVAAVTAAGAGKAATTVPTALKALLGAGIATGAVGGGLYWGAKRNMLEDGEEENKILKAKIEEYQKIRRMLEEDLLNEKIKSRADMKKMVSSY